MWLGEGLESDIEEDLIMVAGALKEKVLSEDEYTKFEDGDLSFKELKELFKRACYTDKGVTEYAHS